GRMTRTLPGSLPRLRSRNRTLTTAEADRGCRPGFPRCNVLAGGPGGLAERSAAGGGQSMKSGNQRPYWAGILTGAGVTLLGVWVSKQAALIAMDYELYILVGIVGLVFVLVGAFLHSPLR